MEPAATSQGAIVLKLTFSSSALLYRYTSPRVLIDGIVVGVSAWGTHLVPVRPGQHRVEIYVPYALPRKVGRARTDFTVAPSQEVRLEYMAPRLIFAAGSLRVPGEDRFRWLSLAARALTISAVALVVVASILVWIMSGGAEDPLRERSPDPRAVLGSESDITLEKTVADHGLALPGDAEQIKYKSRADNSYYLYLTFVSSCDSASRFLSYGDLPKVNDLERVRAPIEVSRAADMLEMPGAQRASEFYGRGSEGRWASRQRLGEGIGGGVCRTIFYAIDDGR